MAYNRNKRGRDVYGSYADATTIFNMSRESRATGASWSDSSFRKVSSGDDVEVWYAASDDPHQEGTLYHIPLTEAGEQRLYEYGQANGRTLWEQVIPGDVPKLVPVIASEETMSGQSVASARVRAINEQTPAYERMKQRVAASLERISRDDAS